MKTLPKKSVDETKENDRVRINLEFSLDAYMRLKKYAETLNMQPEECALSILTSGVYTPNNN